mgnify:CR=1 FL=1
MANLAVYNNPGLATMTSTRVDSAAKHILACKVDSDLMLHLVSDSIPNEHKRRELHVQKHKYCMFKNDLVMNVSQPLFPTNNSVTPLHTRAYPAVITTMADVSNEAKTWLAVLYSTQTGKQFETCREAYETYRDGHKPADSKQVLQMPYFLAQGYALGTAYASDQTGDTVASVLIGGMQTVMNGAFACQAGDVLQWYFEFEENMFYPKTIKRGSGKKFIAGSRKEVATINQPDEKGLKAFMTHLKGKGYELYQMKGTSADPIKDSEVKDTLIMSLFLNKTGNYKDKPITNGTDTYYVFEMTDATGANQYTIMKNSKSVRRSELLSDETVEVFDNYAGHNKAFTGKIAADNEALSTFAGDPNKKRRREFNERMDGMPPEQKGNKFYPKPYRLFGGEDVYGDKIRIFAKCVSGGRPHEMIDVMLMTQSL